MRLRTVRSGTWAGAYPRTTRGYSYRDRRRFPQDGPSLLKRMRVVNF
jgi:hypothetical protein